MLRFNNYPPEEAGDAELGQKVQSDIKIIHDGCHSHYHAPKNSAFMLLGMAAARGITETLDDVAVDQLEGVIDILKPIVNQVGELTGESDSSHFDTSALNFARGVFRTLQADLPAMREFDETHIAGDHHLFQHLTTGVSQEAAAAIEKRQLEASL